MSRGKDTVIQNTGKPNPEDETYLSLLKGTVSPSEKNIKVKIKKENSNTKVLYTKLFNYIFREKYEKRTTSHNNWSHTY